MHTVPLLAYTVTMDARPSTLPTLLAAVLLGWCAPGLAATVYKTTDDSGAVSFSDKPPADATAAETIHIDTAPPLAPEESARRLEATRATTERMAADRFGNVFILNQPVGLPVAPPTSITRVSAGGVVDPSYAASLPLVDLSEPAVLADSVAEVNDDVPLGQVEEAVDRHRRVIDRLIVAKTDDLSHKAPP